MGLVSLPRSHPACYRRQAAAFVTQAYPTRKMARRIHDRAPQRPWYACEAGAGAGVGRRKSARARRKLHAPRARRAKLKARIAQYERMVAQPEACTAIGC